MRKQQNRTLGAFEKTFWLLDQVDSKDFSLAADIEGKESVANWRKAIDKAQERHPNLSVRIVMDPSNRPVFEHVPLLSIPLRVVEAEEDYRWEQEVEKELAIRFNTDQGPLLRAVLVQKSNNTVLILTGHHSMADGTSITYLFRDILRAISGEKLEIMDPQKSNDETLELPEDVAIIDSDIPAFISAPLKTVAPKISTIRFSEEHTQIIIEKSREEHTTVHGALCAAVLIASRRMRPEWAHKKIELISPICSRGALRLDDNYGLNITTHPVYFEGEQDLSFWEIARLAKAGLSGTDTAEHVKNYLQFFRDFTFNSADIQTMVDILKDAFNQEIMVTNLGRLKYQTNFGKLNLKAVYGPMVRSGKGKEQTIGALSINGALCLTNTSDTPIDGLLEAIEQILTEACKFNNGVTA